MIGIGIDTGGTCTDAVVFDLENRNILASGKSRTTHEQLEIGIRESLRKLPRDLIDQAAYISLSTTLATNACVENKGGRVCLIFIGVDRKTVMESYQNYGFEGTDFMRFLDANVTKKIHPNWEELEAMIPELLENYDGVAISQLQPRENNGAYEKEAREHILAHKKLPVVCAYELFKDLNAIKRGAGALLNVRLIPVMNRFFQAVHHVLEEEQIRQPFYIMRSDGSLVSEEYSMQYPVETLLCGPTASAMGGMELMASDNAIIIDMGGTTSDIAIISDGQPIINTQGVKVGDWETFVRGIEIDTFALGGDTHVCYKDRSMFLENRRVMPLSTLAAEHPKVLEELKKLQEKRAGSSRPLYEHLIRMKSLEGIRHHYTEHELAIYDALENGPMGINELAESMNSSVFNLKPDRLEAEGVILRSGFTPTDAMAIRGDRTGDNVCLEAAELAASFIEKSTGRSLDDVVEETYRLVKERLYCNLVRVMWQHTKPSLDKKTTERMRDVIMAYAKEAFAKEYAEIRGEKAAHDLFLNQFCTESVLLGVGAPTHVFLGDVAKALHTQCRVSEFSGVSNALGAILGDACTHETIHIGVSYDAVADAENEAELDEGAGEKFIIYGPTKLVAYDFDEAVRMATEVAEEIAVRKTYECGARTVYEVTSSVKKNEAVMNYGGAICLGADVTARARGKF